MQEITGKQTQLSVPVLQGVLGVCACYASTVISTIAAGEGEGMDMSSGKITMDDVANMAGVTKSMVSRYFGGGSVRESARGRIQEIIRKYSCEPNTFARLEAKENSIIGVASPALNLKVSSRVVTSIGRYLREQGYETLIRNSNHNVDLGPKNIQRLIILEVDGVILSVITITEAHHKLIQGNPVFMTVLAQDYGGGISVVHDDHGVGEAMGVRVVKTRPARIGYTGVSALDVAVGVNRKQGMMDDLKEWSTKDVVTAAKDYSYVGGTHMAEEVTGQGPVDAVICATDRLVFGAYHALGEGGLRIPEDVSVAGFGGYDESTPLRPNLTTLCSDFCDLGYLGAETMLKTIHRKPVPKKQVVDYTIIEGHSVKEQSDF